jgi:hypothetical protein
VWGTAGLLLGLASVTAWILAQGDELEQRAKAEPEQAVA